MFQKTMKAISKSLIAGVLGGIGGAFMVIGGCFILKVLSSLDLGSEPPVCAFQTEYALVLAGLFFIGVSISEFIYLMVKRSVD